MKRISLLLFVTAIIFTSCQKDVSYSSNNSDSSTQYNYVNFSIAGKNISFTDSSKTMPDTLIAYYFNGVTDSTLQLPANTKLYELAIEAVKIYDTAFFILEVDGLSPLQATKYNFIDSITATQPAFVGAAYELANSSYYPVDSTQISGYTQLTTFDLNNKIIEGTFVENGTNLIDENGNLLSSTSYNMTNGKFRMKMQIIDQAAYDQLIATGTLP